MNKSYEIIMFLIILNLVFVMLMEIDVFPAGSIKQPYSVTNPVNNPSMVMDLIAVFTSIVTVGASVGLAAMTRSSTPLGIGAFASAFFVTYFHVIGIFLQYDIDPTITAIITVPIGFGFIGTIVQMAINGSFKVMA